MADITCNDFQTLKTLHKIKGLELHAASGLSATVKDRYGSATAVVDTMLGTIEASFDKDERIAQLEAEIRSLPTRWAYDQSCKAVRHWRREARRLAKLAGVEPREMKIKP